MIEVIIVAKPGQYVAAVCDEPDCYQEAPEASTERRAIRNAAAAGFAVHEDGTFTCPGCRRAKEAA